MGQTAEMSELQELNAKLYSGYRGIKNIDIYLTPDCNFHCDDCLAGDIRDNHESGELIADPKFVFETLDKLRGISSVHFAGWGEPFTYPYIFDVAQHAGETVLNEVRINTNGSHIPLDDEGAEKFITSLPPNAKIYLSVDDFHEGHDPDIMEKVKMFKKYCGAYDIPIDFSIRVLNKDTEQQAIIDRYNLRRRPIIVNRVLKQGWARNIDESRYIDLDKLRKNIRNLKTPGILPDGTVVADFIAAYLPEEHRPKISVIGNVNDESLLEMFERYDEWVNRRSSWKRTNGGVKDHDLASMMDDMGDYPFAINNWRDYSWRSEPVKGKLAGINAGTAKMIGNGIMDNYIRLTGEVVSDNGLIYLGHKKRPQGADKLHWEVWKRLYGDEFTEHDRDTVLQFQRLWKNTDSLGLGNSFWMAALEERGHDTNGMDQKDFFREFVKATADTDEKMKVVGYLNSQKKLIGNTPKATLGGKALKALKSYITAYYDWGKSNKMERLRHMTAKNLGYDKSLLPSDGIRPDAGTLLAGLVGFIESYAAGIPIAALLWYTSINTDIDIVTYMGAYAGYRALTFLAGNLHDFKGKANL